MDDSYHPKDYWENRLSSRFNLKGVGHISFTENYNHWLYRRKRRCLERCLREFHLSGKDVLDIGCGTGYFIKWYLEQGANVCGIDITDTSIQRLRLQFKAEFRTQDIGAADYQTLRKYDIVNMWDVVYHIVSPDAFTQAFRNIASSLKNDGVLIFTDWLGAAKDKRIASHVQARCLETYNNMLPQMGFSLVTLYPLYHVLNRPILGVLDNHLGWLYFRFDNLRKKVSLSNLSLSVWRYKTQSDRFANQCVGQND